MDFDARVKLAVYELTAATGRPPTLAEVAARIDASIDAVANAYDRLARSRLLVLEPDGVTIRMAPPFSGVPTQHRIRSAGIDYHANCAWDAFGIAAALGRSATVTSRCEETQQPLRLEIGADGPDLSAVPDWRFHTPVPAARWWQDIVFT